MPTQSSFFRRVLLTGNPHAHSASIVVRGQARFTVLTARLIRLEWSAGQFEDRATFAFPTRAADPPAFTVMDDAGVLVIDTGALQLRYLLDSGPFTADNLSITQTLNGTPITWRPGTPDRGNLRGTRRTLDGAAGPVTLSEGILSRDGWALHDDSRSVVFSEGGGWVAPRPDHDLQDLYFFGYGHDYTAAVREYTRFGGAAPLIPRYVLGAWWSRYWAYSDADLKQLVADFASHDLPLDVLVIDMDWHTPDAWTGYTWNRELFPDPAGFLRWAHNQGLHVTLNLHPAEGVQRFEAGYPEFARANGVDPASGTAVAFRPGNREFMQHYFEMLHHPMEEQGVDFWWLDWQQGEASDIQGLDPLPWLNHLHFLDSARRGQRPMLYSRWGGLGNHRYYIGFSGDTFGLWPVLDYLPYFTASAANVLYGWWSHDIGGHFGQPSPELYARWVQYGVLSPCLRLHSTKDAQAERRPWAFPPEAFAAAHAAFHLRYQLVPYLYTMARVTADSGIALCRPLYYEYPEDESAYLARNAYFLGDQIIAAPITSPAGPDGIAAVDIWLPPGQWYDFQTHERFSGPRWVRLSGDLNRVPMLVRAGGIVPQAPPARSIGAIPADELIVEVFPGATGSFRYYEDDGTTQQYIEGQYEWTPITMQIANSACVVTIGPTEGHCDALPTMRGYELRLPASNRPDRVLIGDDEAEWSYDEAARTTVVTVPQQDKRDTVAVTVMSVMEPIEESLADPFVHILEYSTLPEAARALGTVVVAAPRGGTPFDVSADWRLHGPAGTQQQSESVTAASDTVILTSPFAFQPLDGPLDWEVAVTVRWQGGETTEQHRSATLCPAVSAWRIALYDPQQSAVAPENLAAAVDLEWQTYAADVTTLPSLLDPFMAPLGVAQRAALESANPPAVLAVTTINSNVARDVRIAYSKLIGGCWLNGARVAEAAAGSAPPLRVSPPLAHEAHLSEVVRLRAGANTLLLNPVAAPGLRPWEFYVAAALADPDGAIATGLRYQAD